MFNNRNIVCSIEFGSSKICVLVGRSIEQNHVDVIGRGEVASDGIRKGEIVNMEKAFARLGEALELADKSSSGEISRCGLFLISATGCGISSRMGTGTVVIKNDERRVSQEDIAEAHENAKIHPMENDHIILNSSISYFMIDGKLRSQNPLKQSAYKLDAHVHIVHGIKNRIENFQSLVIDSGYDTAVESVFSPLAAGVGILSKEDREQGALLIDLGAEVTEFEIEQHNGVHASGMIQVGFNHIINDLSIGLELPFESCRKLIHNGTLAKLIEENAEFLELPSATGKVRKIPLDSFETIIDLRVREICTIIEKKINDNNLIRSLNNGVVLTGGGALFPPCVRIFREFFDLAIRVGQPMNIAGASTGLESPRYSTAWGTLRLASFYSHMSKDPSNPLQQVVEEVYDRMKRAVGGIRSSFKV